MDELLVLARLNPYKLASVLLYESYNLTSDIINAANDHDQVCYINKLEYILFFNNCIMFKTQSGEIHITYFHNNVFLFETKQIYNSVIRLKLRFFHETCYRNYKL